MRTVEPTVMPFSFKALSSRWDMSRGVGAREVSEWLLQADLGLLGAGLVSKAGDGQALTCWGGEAVRQLGGTAVAGNSGGD